MLIRMGDAAASDAPVEASPRSVSPAERAGALIADWDRMTAAGDRDGAYRALTEDLSDEIVESVRDYIGSNLEDDGRKAVKQAYDKIMDAIVMPESKDGVAIRRPNMFRKVVHDRCRDALRTAERDEEKAKADQERATVQSQVDGSFEGTMERRLSIGSVLQTLPERLRGFAEALADDKNHREIAVMFDVTTRTVRYWRKELQGISALRELL